MNYTLTIDDVISIIKKAEDNSIQIVRRDKNDLFIYAKHIDETAIKLFLKLLTASDLVAGPLEDDDPNRKHPIWIFKKKGFGCICYIKLKIINKNRTIIVISFHEDEGIKA